MILRLIKNQVTRLLPSHSQEHQQQSPHQPQNFEETIDLDKPINQDTSSDFSSFDTDSLFK